MVSKFPSSLNASAKSPDTSVGSITAWSVIGTLKTAAMRQPHCIFFWSPSVMQRG